MTDHCFSIATGQMEMIDEHQVLIYWITYVKNAGGAIIYARLSLNIRGKYPPLFLKVSFPEVT